MRLLGERQDGECRALTSASRPATATADLPLPAKGLLSPILKYSRARYASWSLRTNLRNNDLSFQNVRLLRSTPRGAGRLEDAADHPAIGVKGS